MDINTVFYRGGKHHKSLKIQVFYGFICIKKIEVLPTINQIFKARTVFCFFMPGGNNFLTFAC